jgi:hypothetical protein
MCHVTMHPVAECNSGEHGHGMEQEGIIHVMTAQACAKGMFSGHPDKPVQFTSYGRLLYSWAFVLKIL